MKILTSNEAAEKLKISPRRVRALIQSKRLPAKKMGRDWLIMESDLKKVKVRKPGRPKKDKGE